MPKMARRERSWKLFRDAFLGVCGTRDNYRGYCRKSYRRRPDGMQFYWSLVQVAHDLGVSTWLKASLGTSEDYFGKEFVVGGLYHHGKKPKMELLYRSFPILAHEVVHAVDAILGGAWLKSEKELVACAAGYLIVCECWGVTSPAADVEYAKRQGATAGQLEKLEWYILWLADEVLSLTAQQRKALP